MKAQALRLTDVHHGSRVGGPRMPEQEHFSIANQILDVNNQTATNDDNHISETRPNFVGSVSINLSLDRPGPIVHLW
jgi:hypothetical protein